MKNKATGKTYNMVQDPQHLYCYNPKTPVPCGTYRLWINNGSGDFCDQGVDVVLDSSSKWFSVNYYTVSYNKTGAIGGSAPASVIRLKGKQVTVAGTGSMTYGSATFAGWKSNTGTTYQQGAPMTVNGTTTMTPQWKAVAKAIIKLDNRNWSGEGRSMMLQNSSGTKYPLYDDGLVNGNYQYSTDGYIPCGDYDVMVADYTNNSNHLEKSGEVFTLSPANQSTTVRFHTIYFGLEGGAGSMPPRIYANGTIMGIPGNSGLSRDGYSFCYWFRLSQPNTPLIPGKTYTVTASEDLYARWIEGDYRLGDVNMDKRIDSEDARLVMQYAVHNISLTKEQEKLADYNYDGFVDTLDSSLILQAAASGLSLQSLGLQWDDLDWDRLDMRKIDWDTFTMEDLLSTLTGRPVEEISAKLYPEQAIA